MLGERLQQLRKQRDWNQDVVAERIHVSRQTISNWENEHSLPDLQSLLLLADLYQITLDDLVRGEISMAELKRVRRQMLLYTLAMFGGLAVFMVSVYWAHKTTPAWWILAIVGIFVQGYYSYLSLRLSKQKNIWTTTEIIHYLKTGQIRLSRHRTMRMIIETGLELLIGGALGGAIAWIFY